MKRFKIFFNLQKQENWVNDMLSKGYILTKHSLFYHFKKTDIRDRKIRMDFRFFKNKRDYADYVTLYEDSGWTHIGGSKGTGTQFFLQNNNESEEIFSDDESTLSMYKRFLNAWIYVTIILGLAQTNFGSWFFNPKSLYLTPGLWEKTGDVFWKAFIFETPFAVMRAIMPLGFYVAILLVIYFSYRVKKQSLKANI